MNNQRLKISVAKMNVEIDICGPLTCRHSVHYQLKFRNYYYVEILNTY